MTMQLSSPADVDVAGFELTDEQRRLRDEVREFADTVVAPAAYEYDTKRSLPYDIIAEMGRMGLFGLPFPVEYGGQGKDYLSLCLAVEQLGRVDQSIGVTLEAGVGLGAMPIFRNGTEEQKQQWLPMLARGEALAGFGLTEADAGSDASGTKTTAVLRDGEWVINGTKQFITNSGSEITRLVTITAVTGEDRRADGSIKKELSAIIVPTGTPGFVAEPVYDKVGWHTSDTHPLTLTDVRVPEANLLGSAAAGTRTSSRRSTRAGWRSQRSAPERRRAAWRRHSATRRAATCSGARSAPTSTSPSRSRACRPGCTRRGWPIMTPPSS